MHIHSCLGLAPSALLVKTKFIPCTFTTVGRMADLNTLNRVQGLRLCFVFLNLALTDRNIQARFGLRVVWES